MKRILQKMNKHIDSSFNLEIEKTDWGYIALIRKKNNKASGSLYWYEDYNKTIYLSSLKVDKDIRKQGIGKNFKKFVKI